MRRGALRRLRCAGGPLRLRLLVGAGLIAVLAIAAAAIAGWAGARSAALIAETTGAQRRVELFGQISAQVSDYALAALQGATSGIDPAQRGEWLEFRAEAVRGAFRAAGSALAQAVAEAEHMPAEERTRRAAGSIALARMQANFEALARRAPQAEDAPTLRAQLDTFATLFAPLLAEAIAVERRAGQRARIAAEEQRELMRGLALGIGVLAVLLYAVFVLGLIRPLLRRLDRVAAAADAVGRGVFSAVPPVDRRDELGLVFAQVARMAARLGRGRAAIERDRARLEEIVAERTAALQEANARLEEIDTERRRLFADIGHELRTPLTVILAETEIAGHDAADPAEVKGAIATIRARARRLNRRIEDLLRVARSETGQIELEDARFDLAAALDDAMDDVAALARRGRVRFIADLAPAEPASTAARGDRDWSRQVAAGIFENAIRHSPEGAAVTVALKRRGDKIAAEITDEGDGVPEADQARVFERGIRSGRRGVGFGIGLALAAWVMERQHGTIVLTSPARPDPDPHPDRPGTRVTLTWRAA